MTGKCVRYANEMADNVIHSTQYHIKYINKAILVDLQYRPLKLGSLKPCPTSFTPEKFENATITDQVVFDENLVREITSFS